MKRLTSLSNTAALTVSLLYFSFGMAWIELSDLALLSMFDDPDGEIVTQLQTYKGFFFIGVTSLILFLLIRHYLKKIEKNEALASQQLVELESMYGSTLIGLARIGRDGNFEKANITLRKILNLPADTPMPNVLEVKLRQNLIVTKGQWLGLLKGDTSEHIITTDQGLGPGITLSIRPVNDASYEPRYFILTAV